VIGSNKVNELRYQYGVDNSFSGLNTAMGMPGVALSNLFTYGQAGGGSSWTRENRHQVSDNMSWTKGTHQLKFGVDMNFVKDDARSSINSGGPFTYSAGNAISGISCVAPTVAASAQADTNKRNLEFCDWLVDVYGVNTNNSLTGQHWDNFNQFFDNIFPGFPNTFRYIFPNDDYAGFINDTWKFKPNFTVNAGVRYDLQVITDLPNSVAKQLAINNLPKGSFDLPIFDQYTSTYPNEYDAIQPRLGFAWNIKKNTVIRASGGIFFAKTEGHNVKNVISGAGESTTNCKISSGALSGCPLLAGGSQVPLTFPNALFYQQNAPLFTIGQDLPNVPAGAKTVNVLCGALSGNGTCDLHIPGPAFGIRGVDPNLRRPRVYTVTAAIEQQLAGGMNLSISYDYSRGVSLPRGRDFNIGNAFDPNFCTTAATTFGSSAGQTCPGLNIVAPYDVVDTNGVTQTTFLTPLYSSAPAISSNGSTIAAAPAYSGRVDPRTGVINGNSSDANSTYHGMVVSLRKPMKAGLELLANYTLSRATDNGQQGGGNSGEGQVGIPAIDPFNNKAEQGYSGTDIRNRFAASVLYAPTLDKNINNKVVKQMVGGWQLSSTIISQSGSAYTGMVQTAQPKPITVTGFTPGSTASTTYTFTSLDGSMGGAGISSPGSNFAGRIGWLPPGSFRLPSLTNVDLRLTKQFAVKERYHIEVRLEAFNLLNSTLVQAVSQNAYDYASPSGATGAAGVTCPKTGTAAHVNQCMVPISSFAQPTTTTGNLLGARQMQAGVRFEF
jgi:hypothetical protein